MMAPVTGSTAANGQLVPAAEPIARFGAALAALWPEGERRAASRLALAISGGPDSCALLLLAAAALPGRVEAATVDHKLRPEAPQEAADVAALCHRLGVVHRTLEVDVAPGNVQSQARVARYGAMVQWIEERDLGGLATAHHADDQAETLFMRLNRASGVAGLAGTRARGFVPHSNIPLVRPLLNWRRADLAKIVEAAGITAAQDPTNRDDAYDRVRIRKALAQANWLDVAAVAQSAAHLADAERALVWAARREWEECVTPQEPGMFYCPRAPRAVAIKVIARIVAELDGQEPRGGVAARLYDDLIAGRPGSIGDLIARPVGGGWSFSKAPKRRSGTSRNET